MRASLEVAKARAKPGRTPRANQLQTNPTDSMSTLNLPAASWISALFKA